MSDFPRATMTGSGATGAIYSDVDQQGIPSHVAPVPGCGDVLFHHASAINVATISMDGAAPRIALVLAQPGCQCGCRSRGRGLILTPDPEGARRVAERLAALADEIEATAAEQARTALDKAAGK